jgi:hypothetical protein
MDDCNNRYNENTNQQVERYKMEALDRRYDEMWEKHTGLTELLHDFQAKHFENRQHIGNLNYKRKRCWVNLAEQYINEASSPILLGVKPGTERSYDLGL